MVKNVTLFDSRIRSCCIISNTYPFNLKINEMQILKKRRFKQIKQITKNKRYEIIKH